MACSYPIPVSAPLAIALRRFPLPVTFVCAVCRRQRTVNAGSERGPCPDCGTQTAEKWAQTQEG